MAISWVQRENKVVPHPFSQPHPGAVTERLPTYFFQDDAKNDIVGVGIFVAGTWLKLERLIHNSIQQFIRLPGIIHPEMRYRIRRGIVCGVGKPVGMALIRSYWCIICLSKHDLEFTFEQIQF